MISDGWHSAATIVKSPNYNQRPLGEEVDLIVLHNISLPPGRYGGGFVHKFFLNQLDYSADPYFESLVGLEVSAHFFIARDGQLTQFVCTDDRAWHAGRSRFCGREECNDFSIGIELEGCDDDAYTAQQYLRVVELSVDIMNTYPGVTLERIVGHNDVAPGRKTDPGQAFDWAYYRSQLTEKLTRE